MATIIYEDDKVEVGQGDYVYCEAVDGGALSFWGIYNSSLKKVIALDGAGDDYIHITSKLYANELYTYWIIKKVIPCDKVLISIKEKN